MKYSFLFINALIVISCVVLISCKNQTVNGGSCDYEKFSGVLTIDKIENKKDEYGSKFKIISGKFYADDPNAPKSLKPAEFSMEAEDREFPQITVGKRFKLQVSEKITGTCTPRLFEEPEKWIEIPK